MAIRVPPLIRAPPDALSGPHYIRSIHGIVSGPLIPFTLQRESVALSRPLITKATMCDVPHKRVGLIINKTGVLHIAYGPPRVQAQQQWLIKSPTHRVDCTIL